MPFQYYYIPCNALPIHCLIIFVYIFIFQIFTTFVYFQVLVNWFLTKKYSSIYYKPCGPTGNDDVTSRRDPASMQMTGTPPVSNIGNWYSNPKKNDFQELRLLDTYPAKSC